MIKRVEHVGIIVSDMDKSIQFYEEMLGFQLRIRINNGEKELAFLSHPGSPTFEIELIRDLEDTIHYCEHGLVNHVAFVVDDLETIIVKFQEHHIPFVTAKPKQGLGRKTIRFKGPNGEILQLVEERME
ncbi:VOC family protein [Caldifermentibacillus hisashii]|jgi:lactoylglutathione lyase|uniref:VOC family protein n=1 Tax=Caldifermentibacillus hisashii TaxID=996558 RepID=UPI0030EA5D20